MSTLRDSHTNKPGSGPNAEKPVEDFILQAIEAENLAHDIYVQFSQMFFHIPGVSRFWQDLAYDEAKHAYTLKKTRQTLTTEQRSIPADPKLLCRLTNTIALLKRVSLDAVRTLDGAYEIAHELEFSELNYIFKCVVNDFMTQEEGEQFVVRTIDEHQRKLVDFTDHFGDRHWRRHIQARSTTYVASEK